MTGHSEVSRFAPPQTEWRANYVRNSAVKLHPGHRLTVGPQEAANFAGFVEAL